MVIHLFSNATATMLVFSFTADSCILQECGSTDRNGRLESMDNVDKKRMKVFHISSKHQKSLILNEMLDAFEMFRKFWKN